MSTTQIKSAILKILKSYGLNANLKLPFKVWYESANVWLNNINILNYLYFCYKNELSSDKIGLTADFINVVQVMRELFERLGIENYQQRIYIVESAEKALSLKNELNSYEWERLASASLAIS